MELNTKTNQNLDILTYYSFFFIFQGNSYAINTGSQFDLSVTSRCVVHIDAKNAVKKVESMDNIFHEVSF